MTIGIFGYATNGLGLIKSETKTSETKVSKSDEVMKKDDSMIKKDEAMLKVGEYKSYSSEEVANTKDGHWTVIFFNASWCPTCRSTVKDIEANKDKINSNVKILSADYDKETSLKQQYGVTTQHTLLKLIKMEISSKKLLGLAL